MNLTTKKEITTIYKQNILTLIDQARLIHKQNFKNEIELCQLISIKTGGCPEDCAYCSQSNYNNTEIKLNALLPEKDVTNMIIQAKSNNIKRICLGAAYKSPTKSALSKTIEYIKIIKQHNLEACATLGNITLEQAKQLKEAGLDYYNHNIDTSPEFYPQIVTTRKFSERIDTINNVINTNIKVCCGGILGMGETVTDRISFIHALTLLAKEPDSIPINTLVKISSTKLENVADLDKFELIRVIATLRILFPKTRIRLSAGRNKLTELEQTLCFIAGANSIFYGEKLLTTNNVSKNQDDDLLSKLGY